MFDTAIRMEYVRDQYPNCRHYSIVQGDTQRQFWCAEKEKEMSTCNDCRTCSRCDGRLRPYPRHVSYVRTGAYITEEYVCLNCGAYYFREYFQPLQQEKDGNLCQVEECPHHTHEGHRHQEEGKTYTICETHHRKIKTWKASDKGPEQKPILLQAGRLVDNPKYRKKQERKTAHMSVKLLADNFAAKVKPMISAMRTQGVSLRGIAEQMEAAGVKTARGGKWTGTAVKNVLDKAQV